ncbi:unnamed protein product [Caenorhabditis bovis]|uniref:Protein phosphatase n=1 Tax=Caenorhabditis bovis TaxID=2654633 RepID=A0A8S1ESH5_9PELO|nr:unnamed protein product [Caenorhabditis bovis]
MVAGVRLLACGRLAVRAVFSASALDIGATVTADSIQTTGKRSFASQPSASGKSAENAANAATSSHVENVIASCAGFPKDMLNGPSTVLEKGVYGDDAWFISRFKNTFVVGVADGVGGWRKYGIDPSQFSRKLMKECEKRVQGGEFDPKRPDTLLEYAFRATAEAPRPVGSSTACVLVVHQEKLYSANLGDSGFMVVRNGKVILKSREQVHYFNAPFQLTLPPEGYQGFIGDNPDMADRDELAVKKGDIILLATDGVWDNLSDHHVLEQLKTLDEGKRNVQEVCNALALTARRLAFDSKHNSPFAMKAREHGFSAPGGKPDDITLTAKPDKVVSALTDGYTKYCNETVFFYNTESFAKKLKGKYRTEFIDEPNTNHFYWDYYQHVMSSSSSSSPAQWTFVGDDQTYLMVANLRKTLENFNENEPLVFGKVASIPTFLSWIFPFSNKGKIAIRAGVVFSSNAIRQLEKCRGFFFARSTEFALYECCEKFSVRVTDPFDESALRQFHESPPRTLITPSSYSFQFWKGKTKPCCSDHAITFGQLSTKDMRVLEYGSTLKVFGRGEIVEIEDEMDAGANLTAGL